MEPTGKTRVWAWVALGVTALFFSLGLWRVAAVSHEAMMNEAICRELLQNTVEGRQALVSSAWWPPLPALLRMPFAAMAGDVTCPVASTLIGALCGAGALLLLNKLLREWGVPGLTRGLMLAALALSPAFLQAALDGSSGTTVVLLVIIMGRGLAEWVGTRKVRALVYLGLSAALMLAVDLELLAWLLVVFILFVAELSVSGLRKEQKEGTLVLALLPACYMTALWLLSNWLIMGDPLYFVRPILCGIRTATGAAAAGIWIDAPHGVAAGVALLAGMVSALRRDRGGILLAVLGVAPGLIGLGMESRGLLWGPGVLAGVTWPLAILAVGAAVRPRASSDGHLAGRAGGLLVFCVTVWSIVEAGGFLPPVDARRAALAHAESEVTGWLPKIERHVLSKSRFSRVYVCGYESFLLVDRRTSPVFIRSLDFNFNKAKDDWQGHSLYLLVHRPVGKAAVDSIHWKFGRLYELGGCGTLYDGDWGDWRLFEIVQAPAAPRDATQ